MEIVVQVQQGFRGTLKKGMQFWDQPLELKIQSKVGLFSSKQSLNTSQTTLKKLRKSPENDFFDPQNGKITDVNLAKSDDFWVHFRQG